jgi:hypothetical protein
VSLEHSDNLTEDYSNCCFAPLTESGHCDKCGDNAVAAPLCDLCEEPFHPYSELSTTCSDCERDYDERYPHPLDVAEMEDREDRSAGLEEPWWRRP